MNDKDKIRVFHGRTPWGCVDSKKIWSTYIIRKLNQEK